MKMMLWSKVKSMLAPESLDYKGHLLIIGKKNDSNAKIRSNYEFIKENIADAVEVKNGTSSYLLIDAKSKSMAQAQKYLNQIKEVEFIDDVKYKKELEIDNLHKPREVMCSLCGKPLSANRSSLSNLGPICEHKVDNIINKEETVELEFKPLSQENVDKGEMLWIKNQEGDEEFVEIVSCDSKSILYVNHKEFVKEVEKNSNYTEVLKENLKEIDKKDISGVSRIVPKKNNDKPLFDDLMEFFK